MLQSPLAGVSDRVFRDLVRRWAPDALLFTEMVNATSLELGFGRGKVEELGGGERPDRRAAVRSPPLRRWPMRPDAPKTPAPF